MADEVKLPVPEHSLDSVNVPAMTATGKLTRKSIKDATQAWNVYSKLKANNTERNKVNAVIWDKYGLGQPFDPKAMEESGQSNRYNFPTGFLSSIVDKVTPIPLGMIDAARFLTSSSLKGSKENPDAARKSDIIREEVTRSIRQWPDWKTRCTELCQETVLSGAAFMIRLDPYTPWVKFFRLDQAFVQDRCGQNARTIQALAADEDALVSDFTDLIKNREAAEAAGWKLTNCTNALNAALPQSNNEDPNNPRTYDDAVREGNLGTSLSGATQVEMAHLWTSEPNDTIGTPPKVTHFILNRRGDHEVLFEKYERYDSFMKVAALFTLEPGNGRFYGSKGLGKKLINQHLAIERARNRMMDQLEAAGLMVLHSKAANAPLVQFKVRHPFMLVTTEAEISPESIQANVEAFVEADAKLTDLAQQAVGQYLPSTQVNDQGQRDKTAREVSVDYQREQEAKVAFLARFWGQFADYVWILQDGLLDSETTDDIAKNLQARLAEREITREDMDEFRKSATAEIVKDITQQQNQQILALAQDPSIAQSPNIDKAKLERMKITALASASIADELILPDEQLQTQEIEAIRQQMIETEAIISGAPGLPVSPRDLDEVHLKVLLGDLEKGIKGVSNGSPPEILGKLANGIRHGEGHVENMKKKDADQKATKPYEDSLQNLDKALGQVAQKTAAQIATQKPPGPPGPMGQPPEQPQVGPDGKEVGGEQADPSQDAAQAVDKSYKDPPPSIKRQIEKRGGFTPATDQEEKDMQAQKAVEKHPDLPEKIAKAHMSGQQTQPPDEPEPVPEVTEPPSDEAPPEMPPSGGVPPPPPVQGSPVE